METNTTSETLPDSLGVGESDSQEPVNAVATDNEGESTPDVTKLLSETFGREFANQDEALKAVKETKSYVGKAQDYSRHIKALASDLGISKEEARTRMDEAIKNIGQEAPQQAPEGDNVVSKLQQDLNDLKFFKSNPSLEKHEALLSEIRGNTGKTFDEIVESETFKSVLQKVDAHDEMEGKKSVLQSKNRLGKATDKLSEARQAASEGNTQAAKASAVSAVLDAYDLS